MVIGEGMMVEKLGDKEGLGGWRLLGGRMIYS